MALEGGEHEREAGTVAVEEGGAAPHWTAVDWRVEESNAADFPKHWEEMLRWAKEHAGTLEWARLVRDAEDPTHYISFASWSGEGPAAAMRHEEFRALIQRCDEMCRESTGGPGEEVVIVR